MSVKDLAEQDPLSWSRLGETRSVDRADADISTVTASADKVLRVSGGGHSWLLNLEAVASHDSRVPRRLHLKSVMLEERHNLAVRSVHFLLRPEANARLITGTLKRCLPGQRKAYNIFHYEVLRLWEFLLQPLMNGGLGTLPLTALTDEAQPQLTSVVRRIEQRLRNESEGQIVEKARTSLMLLLGLRYDDQTITTLGEELMNWEDSSTARMLIRRGRLEEVRRAIVLVGEPKLGPTSETTKQRLDAVSDPTLLERLLPSIHTARSWDELLAPLPSDEFSSRAEV